ncbi:hypothetical protein GCM10007874_65840 [Labrys miyagiensis]|uniref:Uncharacterized protein n=1 Tax=Labrys miyagiensis TaxID=346912 RepID=A0ABQ6CTC0_9HYPH|nr:hypothetical protein GCM10007874_65840 [Labrys miyagiensis]
MADPRAEQGGKIKRIELKTGGHRSTHGREQENHVTLDAFPDRLCSFVCEGSLPDHPPTRQGYTSQGQGSELDPTRMQAGRFVIPGDRILTSGACGWRPGIHEHSPARFVFMDSGALLRTGQNDDALPLSTSPREEGANRNPASYMLVSCGLAD